MSVFKGRSERKFESELTYIIKTNEFIQVLLFAFLSKPFVKVIHQQQTNMQIKFKQ